MYYRKPVEATTSYLIYIVAEFTPDGVKHTDCETRDDTDALCNSSPYPYQVLVDSRSVVVKV